MLVMPEGIRVVFMRRDSEEIRQSFQAFFDKQIPLGPQFQKRMDEIVAMIRNRKDVLSCHEFNYRNVVDDPLAHFEILQADGWEIDPQKAAAVVDPEYCRFRREELDVGVR